MKKTMERFFEDLAFRLEAVENRERDRDRRLAYRFNIFDYVNPKELDLSKIIAGLLDPKASHGQGMLFLRKFLEMIPEDGFRLPDGGGRVLVYTEKVISGGRRMDILVESVGKNGTSWTSSSTPLRKPSQSSTRPTGN